MTPLITSIKDGLQTIAFPDVCVSCGQNSVNEGHHLCETCIDLRFEKANPNHKRSADDLILPEGVLLQHALWRFDKGGDLQDLMHQLKYKHLFNLGVQLGEALGGSLAKHPLFNHAIRERSVSLLAVPLHPSRFRSRGYNQSMAICLGVRKRTELAVISKGAVIRQKNTRTQTGFSARKRARNIAKAFFVVDREALQGKTLLIADDVFTTGATTFELARTVLDAGASGAIIASVAQA